MELAYKMEVSVLGHRTGTEKITMTERRWRMSKQERQIIRLEWNISIQHNNQTGPPLKCVDLFSFIEENGNKGYVSKHSQDGTIEQKNSFYYELNNTQKPVHVLLRYFSFFFF